MFRALRVHHRVPTRRPKKRPTHLTVIDGKEPQGAPFRQVPVDEAPAVVIFPMLPLPAILLGLPPRNCFETVGFAWWSTTEDCVSRQRRLIDEGFSGALAYTTVKLDSFLRVLAKIARGYDVSQVGLSESDGALNSFILKKDDNIPYMVGGTPPNGPLPILVPDPNDNSDLHQIYPFAFSLNGVGHIAVQIRLFAHLRPLTPVYTVVIRKRDLVEGDPHLIIITKRDRTSPTSPPRC
jgi:hypothetical protein